MRWPRGCNACPPWFASLPSPDMRRWLLVGAALLIGVGYAILRANRFRGPRLERGRRDRGRPRPRAVGRMRFPFDGSFRVESPYGPRTGGFHFGIDFGCPPGTPMFAVGDGQVVVAQDEPGGAGNHLVIALASPPDPRAPRAGYMHLSRFDRHAGDRVRKGEQVGLSGGVRGAPGSGNSRGPHLHFWIGTNGGDGGIDPAPFLKEEEDMTRERSREDRRGVRFRPDQLRYLARRGVRGELCVQADSLRPDAFRGRVQERAREVQAVSEQGRGSRRSIAVGARRRVGRNASSAAGRWQVAAFTSELPGEGTGRGGDGKGSAGQPWEAPASHKDVVTSTVAARTRSAHRQRARRDSNPQPSDP